MEFSFTENKICGIIGDKIIQVYYFNPGHVRKVKSYFTYENSSFS
jgi:hypothetical protein